MLSFFTVASSVTAPGRQSCLKLNVNTFKIDLDANIDSVDKRLTLLYEDWVRIKGNDLDDERREVTDGMDLLTFLRGSNQDFQQIHAYLLIVGLYIVFCYSMAYPSAFDY